MQTSSSKKQVKDNKIFDEVIKKPMRSMRSSLNNTQKLNPNKELKPQIEIKKQMTINFKRIDELSKPKETDLRILEKVKKLRLSQKEKAEPVVKPLLKTMKQIVNSTNYSRQTSSVSLNQDVI